MTTPINPIRALWAKGGAALNAWVHIPSPYSAEIIAKQGFDVMTFDMQHGPLDYGTVVTMMQAISGTPCVPFARVPWNEPSMPGRLLDAGVAGIICPMVNNRAECEAFVKACKYPPLGFRSNGAYRAASYVGGNYVTYANDYVVAMAMIETREAYENMDEIMSTPGLDGIFVGPSDLSLSMYGYAAIDHVKAPMAGHIAEIAKRAKKHGLPAGLFCGTPAYAKKAIKLGYQLVNMMGDDIKLGAAMAADLAAVRK
jgi:4-hydroxy-2-oxoheptanedioate aldolase